MAEHSASTGSIYDLGYRPYEGARLGRAYAVLSLYIFSLRSVFGLGRSLIAKAFPIGLAAIALLPAVAQLGVAAIAPQDFELIRAENYFGYVQVVMSLFCAVAAPDIIGRDQRARTLTLYFSRALSRADYVTAKLAALALALFLVNLLPQVLLLLGGAVAENDVLGYLEDHLDQVPSILASSLAVCLFMSAVSLAVASQSPRRAIATGAVLGYFVIFSALGVIFVETLTGDARTYSLLISPVHTIDAVVFWIFGAAPEFDSDLAKADLYGGVYFAAAIAYFIVGLAAVYRRFQRLAV